jgi:hypothetical protein
MRADCEFIDKAVRIEKQIALLPTAGILSRDEILSYIAAELGCTAAPIVFEKRVKAIHQSRDWFLQERALAVAKTRTETTWADGLRKVADQFLFCVKANLEEIPPWCRE